MSNGLSTACFKVSGRFDGANHATITIDRGSMVMGIHPHHRRRVYEVPLGMVAQWYMERVIKREVEEKRKLKRLKKVGK